MSCVCVSEVFILYRRWRSADIVELCHQVGGGLGWEGAGMWARQFAWVYCGGGVRLAQGTPPVQQGVANDRDGGLGLYLRYGQAEWRDQPPQCRYPTTPVVVQSACNKFYHDHHPEQTPSCLQKVVQLTVWSRRFGHTHARCGAGGSEQKYVPDWWTVSNLCELK